ncbi:MAG TPA: rhodanese-like domain-containing protein [Ktedonobacterales bacterium]|nr:rhodanese-like domain-containing protein [Ktedonobacterales bacterium]
MYFQQFLNQTHGCAAYLIASRQSHEAAIVDPGIKTDEYEEVLRGRDFHLRYVIDTHIHGDHVSGARAVAAKYNAALCLYEEARTTYPFRPLHDREELELGQLRLRVLHTPGHRPELMSLLIVNPPRSPEPSMVLTGDSLLVGDVGRPDFGGGDAEAQFESIGRLLRLPDWIGVFPGHFEGPCGKGMCGRPSTTIGFERLYNPLVQLERANFVAALTSSIPACPLNMRAIEATNRGAADMPWAMLVEPPEVREISVDALAMRTPEAFVLDVREPEEFARGHVPGAASLPQSELALRLDEVPRDRPILVICQSGMRSLRAAQFLVQMGYANVASVAGGTAAWRETGQPVEGGAVVIS